MNLYDIKIVGGTIIDGNNTPHYQGDVGIRDGLIVALGAAPGDATTVIDAAGKIVCPGFIDLHTHYDAQVIWDRMMSISPWHGVTTVLLGNCGFGVAPVRPEDRETIIRTLENVEGMDASTLKAGLGSEWPFETFPEYIATLETIGVGINVGVLIGHTPLRLYVMGKDSTERKATIEEVRCMREIVREALRSGAMGFGTSKVRTHIGAGGKPIPSRMADYRTEILEIAKVLGEERTGIFEGTIGDDMLIEQLAEISTVASCNVTWAAMVQGASLGDGDHHMQMKKSAKVTADGAKVFPQVLTRAQNFEMNLRVPFIFESLPVFKPVSAADTEGRKRIYSDPGFREDFKVAILSEQFMLKGGWPLTVISFYPPDPTLENRSLFEIADERDVHPVDLMLDMALDTDFALRLRSPILNFDEKEVETLLNDPNVVIGAGDGGAHASQLCDACYPTYFLGYWVRQKRAIEIERAIWMLTGRVADIINVTDRGRLMMDLAADVVVLDPKTVGAGALKRVYDYPGGGDRLISEASGIDAVIVNGVVIRRNGKDQIIPGKDDLPGRILKNGRAYTVARPEGVMN